MTNKFTS